MRPGVAPYLAALVVAWWAVVALAVVLEGRRLHVDAPDVLVDENINDDGVELRRRAIVAGEWASGGSPDGLALAPGRSGSVTLAVDKDPDRMVDAVLWFYDGPARTTLGCSRDGREFRTLASGRRLSETRVDLVECGRGAERIWLRFEASREGESTGNLQLVLDKIQVRQFGVEPHLPDVPRWLAAGLLLGGLAGLVCLGWRGTDVAVTLTGALVLIAWLWTGADPGWAIAAGVPIDWMWLAAAVILVLVWRRGSRHDSPRVRRTVCHLVVLWVLGVSIAARWQLVDAQALQPLQPDAVTVAGLASQMAHPYDTGFREPAWVWATWLFDAVAGPSWFSMRLFSLAASIGLLLASYTFVARYFGSVVPAILVMGLLGTHGYLVQSASQGLRTELNALFLILFTYFVFVPGLDRRMRAAGLAAMASGLVLTQLSWIVPVVVLLPYAAWRHGLAPRVAVGGLAIAGLLLTPHLVNNHRVYGDPMWFTNVAVGVFYRNHEYIRVLGVGCEGCPSEEEYATNSYAGTQITTAEYVFGMHSPGEVVRRVVRGYTSLYLEPGPLLYAHLGRAGPYTYVVYLLGVLILLARPWRELLLVPLVALGIVAFLIPLGVEQRLVMSTTPFAATALALPIWLGLRIVPRFTGPSRVRP